MRRGYILHQMEIPTTFLHGEIDEKLTLHRLLRYISVFTNQDILATSACPSINLQHLICRQISQALFARSFRYQLDNSGTNCHINTRSQLLCRKTPLIKPNWKNSFTLSSNTTTNLRHGSQSTALPRLSDPGGHPSWVLNHEVIPPLLNLLPILLSH